MDGIMEKLGRPGCFHVVVCSMLAVTWWAVVLGNVSMTFYGYTPDMQCVVEGSTSLERLTNASLRNGSLAQQYSSEEMKRHKRSAGEQMQLKMDDDGVIWNVTVSQDQCNYNLTDGKTTSQHKCNKWIYDKEDPRLNTIVTEWDLVCDNQYKVSLSNTIFFLGVFFGALIFGFISDYLGRKKTLAICLYTQMPISLTIAFVPNYTTFTILRFLLGVWLQGISTVAFVHCIEFFKQSYRGVVMVGFGISWAVGQMLMSGVAFLLMDWRHMQMFASAIALTTVPYFWYIPESPRWLLVKGRLEDIVSGYVYKAARMNRLNVEEVKSSSRRLIEAASQQQTLSRTAKQESFMSVLKNPILLKRLVIMCYLWCVSGMVYYVFIIDIRDLAGSRFLNFTVGAALEIITNFIIIYIMDKYGRKKPLIGFCLGVTVLCVLSGVPKQVGGKEIEWIVTASSLLGKMGMTAILCVVFVYAVELFPTFARGGCLALCGCCLRVGGILAPQVLFLKSVSFVCLPYIVLAVTMLIPALLALLLPETLGMQMPNNLAEAVNLVPEKKDKNKELLEGESESANSTSEDSLSLTKSGEPC